MGTAATALEITDSTVRVLTGCEATGEARRELVDAALEWIDDPIGLLDERPVSVAELWRSLIETLVGECSSAIQIVHPPDWPRHRIDRVLAAANAVADRVEAVSRDRWQAGGDDEPPGERRRPVRRVRLSVAAMLGAVSVVVVGALLLATSSPEPLRAESRAESRVTVVEGRMAVQVPSDWTVLRVSDGPGSRRLQVSSAQDPMLAVHLAWSYAPEMTLDRVKEALAHAIAAEQVGVFVDLGAHVVAGRPAVTYREIRPGRVVDWTVVVAGATRVSIGCQSPPGRESDVAPACGTAVASAQEK